MSQGFPIGCPYCGAQILLPMPPQPGQSFGCQRCGRPVSVAGHPLGMPHPMQPGAMHPNAMQAFPPQSGSMPGFGSGGMSAMGPQPFGPSPMGYGGQPVPGFSSASSSFGPTNPTKKRSSNPNLVLILGIAGGAAAVLLVVGIVGWASLGRSSRKSAADSGLGGTQNVSSTSVDPVAATAKKFAEEVAAAALHSDNARMADLTYDSVVKAAGGREVFIQNLTAATNQLKAEGVVISRFVVEEPGPVKYEGGALFVVLPTRMEMSTPNTFIVAQSYLLGISFDQGKTWKFGDGTGINKHPERMKNLLPKLPASLELPKIQPPVATKKPQ